MNRDRDQDRWQYPRDARDERWERDERGPMVQGRGDGQAHSQGQGGYEGEPRAARGDYDRDREVYRAQGYQTGHDGYRGASYDRDRDYDRDRWTRGGRGSYERDYQVERERGYDRGGADASRLGRYTGAGPNFDEGGDMTYEGSSYPSSYGRGSQYGHREEGARYTGQGYVSGMGYVGDTGWGGGGASREASTEGRQGMRGPGLRGQDAYYGQGGDVGYGDVGGAGSQGQRFGRQTHGSQSWSGQGQRQSFRGKGPKNYKRSDELIRDEVCRCLSDDHDVDASEVEVSVSDGVVNVSGTVSSRQEKRRIEDLVEGLSGVSDVNNQVRVQRASSDAKSEGSQQGNGASSSAQGNNTAQRGESNSSASRNEGSHTSKSSSRSS